MADSNAIESASIAVESVVDTVLFSVDWQAITIAANSAKIATFFMVMVVIIIITFATFFFIINVNAVNVGISYVPDYGLS